MRKKILHRFAAFAMVLFLGITGSLQPAWAGTMPQKNSRTIYSAIRSTSKSIDPDVPIDTETSDTEIIQPTEEPEISLSQPIVKLAMASTGVRISWNTVENAAEYYIYRHTAGTGFRKLTSLSSGQTTYVDTTAVSGTTYYYTVKAVCGSLASTYDKNTSILYLSQPAVTPANEANGVTVKWSQSEGASYYRLFRRTASGSWTKLTDITASSGSLSYSDTTAESGTFYYYTVRAINGNSRSTFTESSGIFYLACPAVSLSNTANGISINWTDSSGASFYRIYRKTASGSYAKLTDINASSENLSYSDASVQAGTAYFYTVRAYGTYAVGNTAITSAGAGGSSGTVGTSSGSTVASSSNASDSVSITYTSAITANCGIFRLTVPALKSATASAGYITVSWSPVTGANGYHIYRKVSGGGWKRVGYVTSSKTSFDDSTVNPGTKYYYTVRAYRGRSLSFCALPGVSATAKKGIVTSETISWKSTWKYASYSKAHASSVTLYHSASANRNGYVIAVNAGHGSLAAQKVSTLCHPDGSAKIVSATTTSGATTSVGASAGTTLLDGTSEAAANLSMALILKQLLLDNGYDVLMIRSSSDCSLDNIARTVYANNNADCHIAIHYDSTTTDKGIFYVSVPSSSTYRSMEPVASHYKQHEALGSDLIAGCKQQGLKIFSNGSMQIDLTQTSYSTIPSVDFEIGDRASSHSTTTQQSIAQGILKGLDTYFGISR